MSSEEENLIKQIEQTTIRLNQIRINLKNLNEQFLEEETEFIGAKLELDTLNDKLRRLRLNKG